MDSRRTVSCYMIGLRCDEDPEDGLIAINGLYNSVLNNEVRHGVWTMLNCFYVAAVASVHLLWLGVYLAFPIRCSFPLCIVVAMRYQF